MLKKKINLLPYNFNPADYDFIIIGTPVWAGSFALPIKAFLDQNDLSDKKIALFATHQGGIGNALKNMRAKLSNSQIISEKDFNNEKDKKNRSLSNARHWAKLLMKEQ